MPETQIRTRNNDIICVLEIALDVCSKLVQLQKKWETDFLYFKIPAEADYHTTNGQFAPELLQCIYYLIPTKESNKNISNLPAKIILSVMDAEKSRTKLVESQIIGIRSICYDGCNMEYDRYLHHLLETAEASFLPPEKRDSLTEKIRCFLDSRWKLAQCDNPFPNYGIMDCYLQCYYQLLAYFILNEQLIKTLGTGVLHTLLQLDSCDRSVSLCSPIAMNRLRRMYVGIEKYYKKLYDEQDENAVLALFYQSVIKQKVLQSFRWFTNGGNGALEHVAVSSYVDDESSELRDLDLKVMRTDIDQYNSYEGIGEMRIAEKILYEMEKYFENQQYQHGQFRVAILGDVNRNRMEELDDYLNGVLKMRRDDCKLKLVFDIYTKNDVGESSGRTNIQMTYHRNLDEIFTGKEQLEQLLQEHEVVFMMDCTKLYYEMEYIPERSSGYLKQRFTFGRALDNATEDKVDICCPNLLDKLYGLMTVYDRRGELGIFSKRANDALLKFCEEQIHLDNDNYHTLYVYVSDLTAFNNIYCNDKYYMRTERYNQKEIGIIRYTNHDNKEEQNFPTSETSNEKVLCFNIWQIVKHICLEKRNDVIKTVLQTISNPNGETISDYDLHCMHVGVDYREWPRHLTLHYAVVDDGEQVVRTDAGVQEAFLKTFVENVIIPVFNQPRAELFQKYIWKANYSLMYGAAKNVEEMLLIYLLQNKSTIVGKAEMAGHNEPECVGRNINRKYKYSIKRFVAMIISQFDISAFGALDQMWTAFVINKSDQTDKKEERLFCKVGKACVNIGYMDSYLYHNCINVE